jgi:hypothetical protein
LDKKKNKPTIIIMDYWGEFGPPVRQSWSVPLGLKEKDNNMIIEECLCIWNREFEREKTEFSVMYLHKR